MAPSSAMRLALRHARCGGSLAKTQASELAPSQVDTSIEGILARSRRRDLIARVGPQAARYLPTEDPNALLLPDSRLEPSERQWQRIFVAAPWMAFACMLAAPFLLVYGNLPLLQQRAEQKRQVSRPEVKVASFQVVNFGQMPDVLERPFPTMLLLFHPAAYGSKVWLPVLRELDCILRRAELPVSVAALDVSAAPAPPASFLWEYPVVAPHLQLIMPRSLDGEAGVVDFDGSWTSANLLRAACGLAGPAAEIRSEEAQALELKIQKLRDLLFELLFLEELPQQQSRWSWLRAKGPSRLEVVQAAEESIDTSSLEAAIESCEQALGKLREAGAG